MSAGRYVPDLTPLPCCGHPAGAHECGLCQVNLNDGPPHWGNPPIFCKCPDNYDPTKDPEDAIWECPDCYAENADSLGECWNCGAER